jgi:hypothetical protein
VPDLLQTGLTWLAGRLHEQVSRPVTYERGADSVVLQATPGKTEFEQTDAQGFRMVSEVRDWLIPATDLVLAGIVTLPERGDRIRETDGDTVHVYEVVPVGGAPPYRFTDPYRTLLRVHVREIDTEEV